MPAETIKLTPQQRSFLEKLGLADFGFVRFLKT
jgi:hypothetical protein